MLPWDCRLDSLLIGDRLALFCFCLSDCLRVFAPMRHKYPLLQSMSEKDGMDKINMELREQRKSFMIQNFDHIRMITLVEPSKKGREQ